MAEWAGFSDEDLRRLKGESVNKTGQHRLPAKNPNARPQKAVVRPRQQRPPVTPSVASQGAEPVTAAMRLSMDSTQSPAKGTNPFLHESSAEQIPLKEDVGVGSANSKELEKPVEACTMEVDVEQAIEREKTTLHKFQEKQKMMEELNKKKKEMLVSAIKERKQKASAEASKLNYLQKELAHLDKLLNVDVSILRDKIESASRDYVEAKKRYDRSEKEFVEAKMELHKSADMKDQLTEHLYSIIHQNEVRKAKKLAELMDKLDMEFSMETMDMDLPQVPQLSILNSVPDLHPGETGPRSPTLERRRSLMENLEKQQRQQEQHQQQVEEHQQQLQHQQQQQAGEQDVQQPKGEET